jgi:hypothetical protein
VVYGHAALSIQMLGALILFLSSLTTIRDCGNGLGRAELVGFDSQPASPRPGDNVSLWVAYTLPSPAITDGTSTYSVVYNGIPFPKTVDPLCEQTTCPKSVGFNNETSWSLFPSGLSGKVVSTIEWADQNDDLVWCVETTWKV